MRISRLGLGVLAVVVLLLLVRAALGALFATLKLGVALAVGAALVYGAYQLYSGWTAAR